MTEIEKYAIELLHEGGEGIAEDDLNEAGGLDDDSHQEACALSIAMAHAIRDNDEGFLAWFRRVSVEDKLTVLVDDKNGAADGWIVPKIAHDEDEEVTPNIFGDWIYRSQGQGGVEHTRRYAAQLLAAADELERRQGSYLDARYGSKKEA
jgi:hypothetical protein